MIAFADMLSKAPVALLHVQSWFILHVWMQELRYKHEYLDRVQSWKTVIGDEKDDESDIHLEARDRRSYILVLNFSKISYDDFTCYVFDWFFIVGQCQRWKQ